MTRPTASRETSGLVDRRWTAIVTWHPSAGLGIEEVDVDAPNRTAARTAAAVVLDRDYVPGWVIVDVVPIGATCPLVIVRSM